MAGAAIDVDFYYEEGEKGTVHSRGARRRSGEPGSQEVRECVVVARLQERPDHDIRLKDCTFVNASKPQWLKTWKD